MSSLPTRVLAGVTVPDTPLITKSLAYARKYLNDMGYNHVVRSWLLGVYIADYVPAFQDRDVELQSIAAILHDLGWSTSEDVTSKNKRFEIDGANSAREFLKREADPAEWDKHRLQLVWDAIALHTTFSIAVEKEIEVQSVFFGISADFSGPEKEAMGVLTKQVWDQVVKEYPRTGFREGVKEALCHLCRTKPETTYDNFVVDFGVKHVEGYTPQGPRVIDLIENTPE